MSRSLAALAALALLVPAAARPVDLADTRLVSDPAASGALVAFAYANDLWVAGRDGAGVRRLTSHPGVESGPRFSPDGAHIAFTGRYEGNTDVYVVPAAGGVPQAAHVPPRKRHGARLHRRRPVRALLLRRARSTTTATRSSSRCRSRAASRRRLKVPNASQRRDLARREDDRLRPARRAVRAVEALPGRLDRAHPAVRRRRRTPWKPCRSPRAAATTPTRCGSAHACISAPTATASSTSTRTTAPARPWRASLRTPTFRC